LAVGIDVGTASLVAGEAVVRGWSQTPESVRQARRQLRDTLRLWGLADLVDDSALVLSELLSNAVEHSLNPDRTVQTRFSRLPGGCGVRIEVRDADTTKLPLMRPAGSDDDVRGRGLQLVDDYTCHRWGVDVTSGTKVVWGEVTQ
jgi:anti-sigma regulatory factor (Ser/Thr protein kinase)